MVHKDDVLAHAEYLEQLKSGLTAAELVRSFKLTPKAAEFHIRKLTREGLIAPRGRGYGLTTRGRQRLAWYRGEDGGSIEFR